MKNTLVQYQGGGYAGCFWEWNYFFLDKDGMFLNVFSSGHEGIEITEQAKELFERAIEVEPGRWTIALKCGSFYTYDMTDDKAIEEFSRECNVVNITGVLQWFEDNPQDSIDFFVLCSECGGRQTNWDELSLADWHGCGGIQSTADKLICSECYSMGTCRCCDSYLGNEDLIYLIEYCEHTEQGYMLKAAKQMIDDEYSDVCEGCLIQKAEEIENEEHGDMLHLSLMTGEPDMFSDEMRWFWGDE